MKRLSDIPPVDQERAREIAFELRDKIAEAWPKPYDPVAMEKIHQLRGELELLGFIMRYSCELNLETLKVNVVINLFTLKESVGPAN